MILELPPLSHIGHVAKTHGYKGEVSLKLLDGIRLKKGLKYLFIGFDGKPVPFRVQHMFGYTTKVTDCDTELAAKNLCRKAVYAEQPFVKTTKNQFAAANLVGLALYDQHGENIGTVEGLEEYNQTLVKTIVSGKEVLLPLNEQTLLKKDKQSLHLHVPEGLIEFYTGKG